MSVSVAGTVSDARLVQFTTRGWTDVDLSVLTADLPADADVPLLLGNDATLAGLAEARTGAARGAGTALHLLVAVGLGGTLVVNGEPVTGAHGAAGEYGHVPFGDRRMACPCGARGCWDLSIDGRALARHLAEPPPDDPVAYARRGPEPPCRRADDARRSNPLPQRSAQASADWSTCTIRMSSRSGDWPCRFGRQRRRHSTTATATA